MRANNVIKLRPQLYDKIGKFGVKEVVGFMFDLQHVSSNQITLNDVSQTGTFFSFSISLVDSNKIIVDSFSANRDTYIEAIKTLPAYPTDELASVRADEFLAKIALGTREQRIEVLTEYFEIFGFDVLPLEEQTPFYYPPFSPDEPGYIGE